MKEVVIGVFIFVAILLMLRLGSDEHEPKERDETLRQKAEDERNGD